MSTTRRLERRPSNSLSPIILVLAGLIGQVHFRQQLTCDCLPNIRVQVNNDKLQSAPYLIEAIRHIESQQQDGQRAGSQFDSRGANYSTILSLDANTNQLVNLGPALLPDQRHPNQRDLIIESEPSNAKLAALMGASSSLANSGPATGQVQHNSKPAGGGASGAAGSNQKAPTRAVPVTSSHLKRPFGPAGSSQIDQDQQLDSISSNNETLTRRTNSTQAGSSLVSPSVIMDEALGPHAVVRLSDLAAGDKRLSNLAYPLEPEEENPDWHEPEQVTNFTTPKLVYPKSSNRVYTQTSGRTRIMVGAGNQLASSGQLESSRSTDLSPLSDQVADMPQPANGLLDLANEIVPTGNWISAVDDDGSNMVNSIVNSDPSSSSGSSSSSSSINLSSSEDSNSSMLNEQLPPNGSNLVVDIQVQRPNSEPGMSLGHGNQTSLINLNNNNRTTTTIYHLHNEQYYQEKRREHELQQQIQHLRTHQASNFTSSSSSNGNSYDRRDSGLQPARVIEIPERIMLTSSDQANEQVDPPAPLTVISTAPIRLVVNKTRLGRLDSRCPKEGVSTFEHPSACDKYFYCDDGYLIEQTCPNGLMYGLMHRIKDYCVYRWHADCVDKSIPNPISSPGCRWQYGVFSVQGSPRCTPDYYECIAGRFEVKKCSITGQVYDDRTKGCQFAEKVGCPEEIISDFQCPTDDRSNSFWPFPRYYLDQKTIIHCVNDKPKIMRCPEGERVDLEHLYCIPVSSKEPVVMDRKVRERQKGTVPQTRH